MKSQPEPTDRAEVTKLANAVEEALANVVPTSYRNDDPDVPSHKDGPRIGTASPVPQPDSRIVPPWALGIAVASIGVGAGITGIGCGVWLACQGFAAVTLNSVLFVTLPLAGLAMVATAISGLINKAKKAALPDVHNHNYSGTVHQRTVQARNTGVWVKNTSEQREELPR